MRESDIVYDLNPVVWRWVRPKDKFWQSNMYGCLHFHEVVEISIYWSSLTRRSQLVLTHYLVLRSLLSALFISEQFSAGWGMLFCKFLSDLKRTLSILKKHKLAKLISAIVGILMNCSKGLRRLVLLPSWNEWSFDFEYSHLFRKETTWKIYWSSQRSFVFNAFHHVLSKVRLIIFCMSGISNSPFPRFPDMWIKNGMYYSSILLVHSYCTNETTLSVPKELLLMLSTIQAGSCRSLSYCGLV